MRQRNDQEFEEFVRAHRNELVRTATTMAAGDAHLAEDVVQNALVRVYLASPTKRINLRAYVRRSIVNGLIDHSRRSFVRREKVVDRLPDRASTGSVEGADDHGLWAALAEVPIGMRAAVVLRHVEGLSVEETADALGCSTGNVKSQTARGIERLRAVLSDPPRTERNASCATS